MQSIISLRKAEPISESNSQLIISGNHLQAELFSILPDTDLVLTDKSVVGKGDFKDWLVYTDITKYGLTEELKKSLLDLVSDEQDYRLHESIFFNELVKSRARAASETSIDCYRLLEQGYIPFNYTVTMSVESNGVMKLATLPIPIGLTVVAGVSNSGKTTLIRHIAEKLGQDIHYVNEPHLLSTTGDLTTIFSVSTDKDIIIIDSATDLLIATNQAAGTKGTNSQIGKDLVALNNYFMRRGKTLIIVMNFSMVEDLSTMIKGRVNCYIEAIFNEQNKILAKTRRLVHSSRLNHNTREDLVIAVPQKEEESKKSKRSEEDNSTGSLFTTDELSSIKVAEVDRKPFETSLKEFKW